MIGRTSSEEEGNLATTPFMICFFKLSYYGAKEKK